MDRKNFFNLKSWKKFIKKGPLFYARIQIAKFKSRNYFFGWFFRRFYTYYKIGDIKIVVEKNLYPVPLYSRFFFKIYECEEVSLVKKYLKGPESVLELGASIGVVSCVTNQLLINRDQHVAVEANPGLISHLDRNKKINQLSFKIVNAAVTDQSNVNFYTGKSALSGSMSEDFLSNENPEDIQEHIIKGMTPKEIEEQFGIQFDTLLMDIEGGEFEFIKTFIDWISTLSTLMIEFHRKALNNEDCIENYIRFLETNGNFQLIEELKGTYLFQKSQGLI